MEIEQKILKYSDMVYKIAFSMTKTKVDADDIYQEVFIKLFQNEKNFNDEEHEKAWLIRVTINFCKMLYRKNIFRKENELDENIQYLDKEQDEIYIYVKQLPEKYSTVIYLFYYEGYKINEIVEIIQSTEELLNRNYQEQEKCLEKK